MQVAGLEPLTQALPGRFASGAATLSPEGRGDAGGDAGENVRPSANAEALTSPLRGEVDAQRRVRGKKLQPSQVKRARILRSDMTDAENRLWYHLRNRRMGNHKFVRQLPIGPYFADFACREAMLVLEADGGQHSESIHDNYRDQAIMAAGYTVLRFWNTDILSDTEAVLNAIRSALKPHTPSPMSIGNSGNGVPTQTNEDE